VGVSDEPRTDRQPWSHGCRLTSRPPLDHIRRQAQAPGAGARRVARPIQDNDHLLTRSSRGNEQPFSLDGRHLTQPAKLSARLLTPSSATAPTRPSCSKRATACLIYSLVVHEIEETPHEVEFRAPNVPYSRERTSLEWTGRHPERELTYMLRYSRNRGKSWRALSANLRHATCTLYPSRLPGGEQRLFQVVASSGIRTSVAKSEPFTAPTKPRIASTLSPEPRTEVPEGTPVVLRGGANSPDFGFGEIEDAELR
jgi:hypothetical protein